MLDTSDMIACKRVDVPTGLDLDTSIASANDFDLNVRHWV